MLTMPYASSQQRCSQCEAPTMMKLRCLQATALVLSWRVGLSLRTSRHCLTSADSSSTSLRPLKEMERPDPSIHQRPKRKIGASLDGNGEGPTAADFSESRSRRQCLPPKMTIRAEEGQCYHCRSHPCRVARRGHPWEATSQNRPHPSPPPVSRGRTAAATVGATEGQARAP